MGETSTLSFVILRRVFMKYIPRKLNNVVGNILVKNLIKKSLSNEKFPQFSLLYGDSGTGKSTLAEIIGLALTCEKPKDGEPCLKCNTCIENDDALRKNQKTSNIVKLNMARLDTKKDIKEVMDSIFMLQNKPNTVYILEELHALPPELQTPFLEEIEKIPRGVYIIGCTNLFYRLIKPLTGRAVKFSLSRPNMKECLALIDSVCREYGLPGPRLETKQWIVNSLENSPRDIVNFIMFMSSASSLTDEDVMAYLNVVSDDVYVEFAEMMNKDMYEFVGYLEDFKEKKISYLDFFSGYKNFMNKIIYATYGKSKDFFSKEQYEKLGEVFKSIGFDEARLMNVLDFISYNTASGEKEAFVNLIRLRRVFLESSVNEEIKESREVANKVNQASYRKTASEEDLDLDMYGEDDGKEITLDSLTSALEGVARIGE